MAVQRQTPRPPAKRAARKPTITTESRYVPEVEGGNPLESAPPVDRLIHNMYSAVDTLHEAIRRQTGVVGYTPFQDMKEVEDIVRLVGLGLLRAAEQYSIEVR
jgi:hypothetical protein